MSDTLVRHIAMLGTIPALPRRISARELAERLRAQGFEIDVRSVERDLHKLSRFGLVSDEARPAGWSWMKSAKGFTLPPTSPEAALLLELVRRHLAGLLPRSMLATLAQPFEMARQQLAMCSEMPFARWAERIAVLPETVPLAVPEVAAEVGNCICDALLRERQLEVNYRAIEAARARRFVLHPLGLVLRGGVFYLVATVEGYEDARQFALQRMSQPKVLEEACRRPRDFSLAAHIHEQRAFEWPRGEMIRLELRVDSWLSRHLGERPLAADQEITPMRGEEDAFRVRATVAGTEQLHWWLRSLGSHVEVLKPARLRRRLATELTELAARYGADATRGTS